MDGRKKNVSIKDIAAAVGVSPALVSFVLNGKQKQYRVSDQMAEKILNTAREMDYTPNGFARSLRAGTSHTIGVVVSDISNTFFAEIVKNIETTAESLGYMALFASSDERSDKLAELTRKMLAKEVDGMIVVPCRGSEDTVRMLVDRKIPLVLLDRYIPEIRTDYVCLDNRRAAYEATVHLIEQGYERIGFVGYGPDLSNQRGRIEGYTQAMTDKGLKSSVITRYVDMDSFDKSCERAMAGMLENNVDAILFATNTITIKCLYYIQNRGIRIPDDLGIVCFDGESAFDFFYAPISYISQPLERMARKSVEILVEKMASKDCLMQQVEAEGALVKRASSGRKHRK
jgi:LacI family transcriptional regulator